MAQPLAKRQKTSVTSARSTLSCLEQLPFDVFADTVLLHDPVLNANVLASVSKRMRAQVRGAVQTPGFYQRMVQRCFPLITRLPDDMACGSASSWRTLFLRLMDLILKLAIKNNNVESDDLCEFTDALTSGRIVTWGNFVPDCITYVSDDAHAVASNGRVNIEILFPSEDSGAFHVLLRVPATKEQVAAKVLQFLTCRQSHEHEFWMDGPLRVLENGNSEAVLTLGGYFVAEQNPSDASMEDYECVQWFVQLDWYMYDNIVFWPERIDDRVLKLLEKPSQLPVNLYQAPAKGFSLECVVPCESK